MKKSKTPVHEQLIEMITKAQEALPITAIPPRLRKRFLKWMTGQTCALVDGEPRYYPWDVRRFLSHLKGKPVLWD